MPEWKNDRISIDVEYVVLSETAIMVIGTWNNHFLDSELILTQMFLMLLKGFGLGNRLE